MGKNQGKTRNKSKLAEQAAGDEVQGEEIEGSELVDAVEENSAAGSNQAPETFAQSKGLPANAHAKDLAKAKSKQKAGQFPIFYSKKGMKVLKFIAKPGKTVSVFIGNMSPKKHKEVLEGMIVKWKKDGVWLEEHEAKAKLSAIQAEYVVAAELKKEKLSVKKG